jgi:hypothetical protein
MIRIIATVLATAVSIATMTTSFALPAAPVGATPSDLVQQVAGGCGEGFHRGPYGGCRRNYAHPAEHACPRGYHIGPGGGCRGDGK